MYKYGATMKPHTIGDPFYFEAALPEGTSLAGIKCEIRNGVGGLVATPAVAEVTGEDVPAGTFSFSVQDTTDWPEGYVYTNIKANGRSSEGIRIPTVKGVTL